MHKENEQGIPWRTQNINLCANDL